MRPIVLVHLIALFAANRMWAINADEVTVCDLNHPTRFLSKRVSASGRFVFTMHGAFLVADSCSDQSQDVVILFPKAAGTPAVNFDLDQSAMDSLKPFFRTTGGSASACGALIGQLFYKKSFHSRSEGSGPEGNGF